MLDSDVTPDSRLAVRFFSKEVPNAFESEKEGRPISFMADFVRIEVPGDRNTIIETFVNESHKQRFPFQWAQYMNEKADGKINDDVQGTLLRDWPILTPAKANDLKHFKFYTVEQIAGASDEQISSLGMAAGMSPFALRDKAKAYLMQSKDTAFAQSQAEELRKRDEEIAALKEQMKEILAMQAKQVEKPKGRPPKEE